MESDPTSLVCLLCAASCLVAYLMCGIPSALLIGKAVGGVDVRKVGSGNVGSTNVTRAAGTGAGVLTLVCDVAKALVSVLIGYLLVGKVGLGSFDAVFPGQRYDWAMALVYLFCLVGHIFTPYLKFKGGKGIAVGLGGAVALYPIAGVSLFIPFLLFAVATRFVSLGSIAAAISMPFLVYFLYHPTVPCMVVVALVGALAVFAHRSNIVKLVKGTESKFSFKNAGKGR